MTLRSNVKALVILIPKEGNHGLVEEDEDRFIDQHFVPESAIINTVTKVACLMAIRVSNAKLM